MFALKGFVSSTAFVDNHPGVVATIGELSTQSATYSTEKGYYTSEANKGLTLTSFLAKFDGGNIIVPTAVVNHVLAISGYVHSKTMAASGEIYADELLQDLLSKYAASAEDFRCGEIVTDGRYFVPEWLSWKSKNIAGIADNEIRIWFVDASFQLQYDEYEITVVPPIDRLDDFFKTSEEVEQMLAALSMSEMTKRLQGAKNNAPETIVDTVMYNYVDRFNATRLIPAPWGVLTYGAAGNNVDVQRDSLVDFILKNSTRTREEWTKIFPDIFKRTEFVLVPTLYQYAVPDREVQAGIYSPVVPLVATLAKIKAMLPGYPEAHINSHLAAMGFPHKSLTILSVGGPDNRDEKFAITDVFPDYISVATTTQDFNRMSQETKDWINMLSEMMPVAESMTTFSSIPLRMSRVTRDGVLFLVKSYKNINYLLAAKSNFKSAS